MIVPLLMLRTDWKDVLPIFWGTTVKPIFELLVSASKTMMPMAILGLAVKVTK